MTRLLPLLLLLPTLALGQGLTPLAPGQTGGGKTLASYPFSTPGCYASGTGGVSITRAASSTYESPSGTINTCAAGSYRVEESGLLVEPSKTNYVLQSGTISTGTSATSPWALNGASVTTVSGDPAGGSWAQITSTSTSGTAYINPGNLGGTTQVVASVWVAKASGSGKAGIYVYGGGTNTVSSCACSTSDGSSCTASVFATRSCYASANSVTTAPIRVSAIGTFANSITTGTEVDLVPSEMNVSTGTTRFSLAQLEVGTYPTSYIPTTGTSASRAADRVSVPTIPALPRSRWCIAITANIRQSTWAPPGYYGWVLGSGDGGVANTAVWTHQVFQVRDGSGIKYIEFPPKSVGVGHRIVACDKAGAMSLSIDGSLITATAGTGSGIIAAMPTSIYIGGWSGSDTYTATGYFKDLKLCNASKPSECK